ncbi:MAG: hypothetical protein LBT09_12340 [Planctomycetaceae bacterium]|nr:hypothetical protein [Planctomycetaceae bacterium]
MLAIFFDPIIQLTIYIVIFMLGTLAAIYVLGLFRTNSLQQDHDVDKELNYFRELRDKGNLSDVEFRIIKERFSEIITESISNDNEQKSKLMLNYKALLSLLPYAGNYEALQDTQIAGCSGCGNKNGQAEYIEMETKRMKEHDEDCGIDWKTNRANDDKTENNNSNTKDDVGEE